VENLQAILVTIFAVITLAEGHILVNVPELCYADIT
jgi:hypothetical protein